MATKTIAWVKDETREWDGPNGKIVFISGEFKDAQGWSIGCKPDNVQARMAEMKALIDKEGEYELEPGKEYQGRQQWKLKSWPGKPQQSGYGGGGGGKGPYVPAYAQTREGQEFTQRSIQRAVALERAVQCSIANGGPNHPAGILQIANAFFAWLHEPAPDQPKPIANEDAHPPAKTKPFEDFKVWLASQCSSDPKDKQKAWGRVVQLAGAHGFNSTTLQACADPKLFDALKFEFSGKGDDSIPF